MMKDRIKMFRDGNNSRKNIPEAGIVESRNHNSLDEQSFLLSLQWTEYKRQYNPIPICGGN